MSFERNVSMYMSTGNSDSIFFLELMPLFELRNLTKIKNTTHYKTVPLKTAQQNFVKLCNYEGYNG